MRIRRWLLPSAAVALLLVGFGCGKRQSSEIDSASLKAFSPLPDAMPASAGPATEAQIALGRMLYYEPRLSMSQTISCNSCHDLAKYGVDGEPTSEGHKGQRGDRNAPTVYNAAGHFVQFWDGRAVDVEEQAKGPVLNPVEMAMPSEKHALEVLKSMPEYVDGFRKAFPGEADPVNFDNMAKAIGGFERNLTTPARWDEFLKGDQAALTDEEKAGFNTYVAAGCPTCHAGALMGGNLYQRLGLMAPYGDTSDPGRFKVTKNESDKMVFKVPSLRNIEKTGPYFHNGKVDTIEGAVAEMAELQLGKKLSEAEVNSIVAWLKTLTGSLPAEYIQKPALPPSTTKTPKPETGV